MDVAEAFSLIARAIDAGHAAHGYLIVGDLSGNCQELAQRILEKLFPDDSDQIANRCHPDVAYLEPEGIRRIIKVESMRDRIIEPMALASFAGGWKVGVIVGADRLEPPTANAFLKSLEEPTPKTLYLLLTDQPDVILPTIASRTQRINLPRHGEVCEGGDLEAIADAFWKKDAAALASVLTALKEAVDADEIGMVRKRFFRTLIGFVRQLMTGGKVPRYRAFRNIEAVEAAYRQIAFCSMSEEMVLAFMLDRLAFE